MLNPYFIFFFCSFSIYDLFFSYLTFQLLYAFCVLSLAADASESFL